MALFSVGKTIVPLVGSSHRSDSLSVLGPECGLEFFWGYFLCFVVLLFVFFLQVFLNSCRHIQLSKKSYLVWKRLFCVLRALKQHTHTQTHIFERK